MSALRSVDLDFKIGAENLLNIHLQLLSVELFWELVELEKACRGWVKLQVNIGVFFNILEGQEVSDGPWK